MLENRFDINYVSQIMKLRRMANILTNLVKKAAFKHMQDAKSNLSANKNLCSPVPPHLLNHSQHVNYARLHRHRIP